jgi:hypothetical protein
VSVGCQVPDACVLRIYLLLSRCSCGGYYFVWELGSLVIIVSDYGLDVRTIEVRSPAEACVQISSEAGPSSCPMCAGGPFPRSKARPVRDADHSPPSSVVVENE